TAVITLTTNLVVSGAPAQLRIETQETMDLAVTVCDAAGRVLNQTRYRLYTGANQFEVPTDDLSAGIYTVLLQNEKGATVKRLVVVE
ncbi:MAG: T9SS type A sorting domain-containing protein, partial [Saprospiraceae bacterium]